MRKVSQILTTALVILVLTACSSPDENAVDPTDSADGFNTTLSVQDIMVLVLEPASDYLWRSGGWILDFEEGYRELYPTTDEGWAAARAQAAVVVESGNMLTLPGRTEDNDAWLIYSEGLSEAGLAAMDAASRQNEEDFFQAGANLYSVCTACHQAYNPEILDRFAGTAPD